MTDYFGEGENNWQMVGLKVFLKIWGWLIGPLVFFLFLGKFLESRFATLAPWPFVVCMGLGFAVTIIGIFREILFLWKITYVKDSHSASRDHQQAQRDYFNSLDDNNSDESNRN
ncbi:MAG: AtpZ/AtpI family protein [Patescibacteria group bacterium]